MSSYEENLTFLLYIHEILEKILLVSLNKFLGILSKNKLRFNPMNSIDVFETLAAETWKILCDAEKYQISQNEETITDNNILYMKRAKLKVIQTNKRKESCQGTDWEWWIGNSSIGWLRYAVQAKKINSKTNTYSKINHKVEGKDSQINILEKYAVTNHAIPLYCFYNYLKNPDLRSYWQCNLSYEIEQFGCTITPLKNVKKALDPFAPKIKDSKRKFPSLHSLKDTKPWRCLVKCPLMLNVYKKLEYQSFGFENVRVYPELPSELSEALLTDYLSEFSFDFYNPELEIYPKRILVADYNVENISL